MSPVPNLPVAYPRSGVATRHCPRCDQDARVLAYCLSGKHRSVSIAGFFRWLAEQMEWQVRSGAGKRERRMRGLKPRFRQGRWAINLCSRTWGSVVVHVKPNRRCLDAMIVCARVCVCVCACVRQVKSSGRCCDRVGERRAGKAGGLRCFGCFFDVSKISLMTGSV